MTILLIGGPSESSCNIARFTDRYEMLVGIPPFYNSNKHKMYQLIENCELKWPDPAKHGFGVPPQA